jgi:hypothetical protein
MWFKKFGRVAALSGALGGMVLLGAGTAAAAPSQAATPSQHGVTVTEKMVKTNAVGPDATGNCGTVTFFVATGRHGTPRSWRGSAQSDFGPITYLHYDVHWTDLTPDTTHSSPELDLGTVTFGGQHAFANPGVYMPQLTGGANTLLGHCTFIPQSATVDIT